MDTVNIRLSRAVHRKLKIHAAMKGLNLSQALDGLLK
jgi:hypothetical protein